MDVSPWLFGAILVAVFGFGMIVGGGIAMVRVERRFEKNAERDVDHEALLALMEAQRFEMPDPRPVMGAFADFVAATEERRRGE